MPVLRQPWGARRRGLLLALALVLILAAAGALRIAGHDWDSDEHLNADDSYVAKVTLNSVGWPPGTSLAALLDPLHSPLNPRTNGGYVYGALPLYLTKLTAGAVTALTGDRYFAGLNGVLQTGRVLAGLFDTATAALLFLIGLRLWGAGAGLAAAALYAGAALPIELGHFYICEPFMATFMAATLLASLRYLQGGRAGWLALAGLAVGLALACKLSAFPVLVLPVGAAAFRAWGRRGQVRPGRLVAGFLGLAALAGILTVIGLALGDPFAILDAGTYAARMQDQTGTQNGATDLWFTRKYVGTPPVTYLWGQLMLIGVGPLVGLAGTLGLGVLLAWALRRRQAPAGLLLLGAGAYFASIAFWEIKWVRYLIPLVPYLALAAVALGLWLGARLGGRRVVAAQAVALGVLALSAGLGGLAVAAIFTRPQTQVAASRWIDSHVPPGSRIGVETTTFALPLALPGQPPPDQVYHLVPFDPLADHPSAAESALLQAELNGVDYLVVDATQARRTVPRLPWRYPVQIRFYDLLFAGRLGFTLAYTGTSYPTVFGLSIPDDGGWVDASFMDASHPPIYIFRRVDALSDSEWAALFALAVQQPSVATRHAPTQEATP